MNANKRDVESLADLFGTKAKSLAVLIGTNCRRIRTAAGVTQDTLATHARDVGLRWTVSKVGQFERGVYNPTLTTVLAVSYALSVATESDVDLTDLMASDGWVCITDGLMVEWGALQNMVCRSRRKGDAGTYGRNIKAAGEIASTRRPSLDTERLAQRLNVSHDDLERTSLQLWGRSFSDERDKRAGPDANPQKRGHVSRLLQGELEKALTHGDG